LSMFSQSLESIISIIVVPPMVIFKRRKDRVSAYLKQLFFRLPDSYFFSPREHPGHISDFSPAGSLCNTCILLKLGFKASQLLYEILLGAINWQKTAAVLKAIYAA